MLLACSRNSGLAHAVLQDVFAWNPLNVIHTTRIDRVIARGELRVGVADMFWSGA